MNFHSAARDFIIRLINLQKHIPASYKRIDQITVIKCLDTLESYLDFYPYETDQKMRFFWNKHRYRIRILMPSVKHPAYAKLLIEFEHLDSFANSEQENAIWQPIANALSKF